MHAGFANTNTGHQRWIELAQSAGTVVCFEATRSQEWPHWTALDATATEACQLPPVQIKAFAASRGTRVRTDQIDSDLITHFVAFRPDAGCTLRT